MTAIEPYPTIREYRRGNIDVETATLRVALFNDSTAYSPDQVNHEYVSDVLDGGTTAQEIQDATYSRQTVSNASVTVDAAGGEVEFDADDVTFSGLDGGETIQGWIVFQQVGGDDTTPADDRIIAIEDEATNSNGNLVTLNGSDVTIQFSSEGIINVA
ncbi:hypothetical protein [Halostella pelagica]|uniref:hypothetical protein n=1 Tax=Halostella pelagica TaxID=2583824 RepID=UPI001080B562|nr:hypothetical protein [Halostella pelagica]